MENHYFETRIREFRSKLGWSQEKLAQEVGVSRETISYLEKGKYNPSLKLAIYVAKALNSSINELFIFKD